MAEAQFAVLLSSFGLMVSGIILSMDGFSIYNNMVQMDGNASSHNAYYFNLAAGIGSAATVSCAASVKKLACRYADLLGHLPSRYLHSILVRAEHAPLAHSTFKCPCKHGYFPFSSLLAGIKS